MGLQGGGRLISKLHAGLLAASVLLFLFPAGARSQSLDAIYARLLAHPDDYALNMEYGAAAEATPHSLRHAYAAYERAVLANPDDQNAREALRRVRLALLPKVTTVTVSTGASYVSNPREAPKGVTDKALGIAHDGAGDIGVTITDERNLLDTRWRSGFQLYAQGEIWATNVNLVYASAYSGPVFDLDSNWRLHIAPLTGTAWLGGQQLFADYGGLAALSTTYLGSTQSVAVRAVYRDVFGNASAATGDGGARVYSNGTLTDIEGRFQVKPGLVPSDTLYITPLLRFSRPDGPGPASSDPAAPYDDPLFTANYTQSGLTVSYYRPIAGPSVLFGAGVDYFHRWYGQNVAFATSNRQDDYIEPSAHLIFPSLLAPNLDLRFDYRFEHNLSNDPLERFDNHVVGVHVVGRF